MDVGGDYGVEEIGRWKDGGRGFKGGRREGDAKDWLGVLFIRYM